MKNFLGILVIIGLYLVEYILNTLGVRRLFVDRNIKDYRRKDGHWVKGCRRKWPRNLNNNAFFKKKNKKILKFFNK